MVLFQNLFNLFCNLESFVIDYSPHLIDFSTGRIDYQNMVSHDDLFSLLKALKSNLPISRVDCPGLRRGGLSMMTSLFEILHMNQSVISVDYFSNLISVSSGSLKQCVKAEGFVPLSPAINSNIPIKNVKCSGLRNTNLDGLMILYELLSGGQLDVGLERTSKVFITIIFSIDVESGIFEFTPSKTTELSDKAVGILPSF
ncbi:hypothetical protein GEMRC1_007676 [Eukaryota sp. GEM-RC1]